MGVRLLRDRDDGCAWYDSVTEWAFGPVFEDEAEAEAFQKFLEPTDPRELTSAQLAVRYNEFAESRD